MNELYVVTCVGNRGTMIDVISSVAYRPSESAALAYAHGEFKKRYGYLPKSDNVQHVSRAELVQALAPFPPPEVT